MSGLWPIVFRWLGARRWRTGLTAASIALGIAVILGVQAVLAGLDTEASTALGQRAGRSALDVRMASGPGFTPTQVQQLNALPGVAEAVALYEKRVTARINVSDVSGVTVTMIGVHDDGSAGLRPVQVVAGRLPANASPSEIAVDSGLAEVLGNESHTHVALGSKIQLTTGTGPDVFTVVGLTAQTSGGTAFTHSGVFISESTMTSTFALGLNAPLVGLRVDGTRDISSVAAEVRATLGTGATVVDPRNGGSSPLNQIRPLLLLLTALSLFVGAGVTANSMWLSALERRRELALLRAGGASAAQVTRVLITEATICALIGLPFGLIAGAGMSLLLAGIVTGADGMSIPAPVTPAMAALAAGIGMGSGIVGAAIPAIIAARQSILDGLRQDAVEARERVPWRVLVFSPVLLVLSIVCLLDSSSVVAALGGSLLMLAVVAALPAASPALIRACGAVLGIYTADARVGAANLARRRNRTALTLSGLTVAIATAIATSSLAIGASSASDAWIHNLFAGNAIVKSPVPQGDAVAQAIASSSDVASVSEVRFLSAPVGGAIIGIAAVDPTVYMNSRGLDITSGGDHDTVLQSVRNTSTVLIPQELADQTAWTVGTTLTLQTGTGGEPVTVGGIVAHSFPAGDGSEAILMSRGLAQTLFGANATGFDALMVKTSDGGVDTLRKTAATYGLSAVSVADIQSAARQSLNNSVGLLEAVAAISVIIAMLAVANTLAVNARQGRRELALMRAVGLSRRRALRLVLVEAATMGLAGTFVGLVTGGLLALPMLIAGSTPGFTPSFSYPTPTAIVLAAGVVLATMLAAVAPARRAVNTSIVSAIHRD